MARNVIAGASTRSLRSKIVRNELATAGHRHECKEPGNRKGVTLSWVPEWSVRIALPVPAHWRSLCLALSLYWD